MKNERNAGRKPVITDEKLNIIKARIEAGESISSISKEYGVSRQALHQRLKNSKDDSFRLEYYVNGNVGSVIEVEPSKEAIHVYHYLHKLSDRAFGLVNNPNWDDLAKLLESQYFKSKGIDFNPVKQTFLCRDFGENDFSINEILDSGRSDIALDNSEIPASVPRFLFTKKDILLNRTDTDGFQLKALTSDRRWFVKAQAVIGGVYMNDWAVEILASSLCRQLNIPCVEQYECEFVYNDNRYKGVYSANFELDGYTFISFERLVERHGLSTSDSEFVKLSAMDKLKWCAKMLSEIGSLDYDKTHKYMLDMAVLDCLVGNVDRHTKNYGLFYNIDEDKFEIPLIFDNGMGLLEHDYYRDRYESFDRAMGNVYVSPYGEDPFDFLKMLDAEYDLKRLYPAIADLDFSNQLTTDYSREYIKRIKEFWQK